MSALLFDTPKALIQFYIFKVVIGGVGAQTSACSLLKRHLRLQRGRRRKKKKDGGIREEAHKEREGGKKKKKTQANVGAFQITTYPRDREWRDGGMKGRAKSMSHAER